MHFTYTDEKSDHLCQGDILRKTPALLDLLREVHPHYANEDYLYFQVLTQSCDLVRRKGQCKSRYITIAAVRSYELVVNRAIEKFTDRLNFKGSLLCSDVYKDRFEDLLNKLFNNNDPHHFFLNQDPDLGLVEHCCTQLHLSISIRAYEHYDVCLAAKAFGLTENFRAKLGWMVGNLYSRVGTQDYVPGALPDNSAYDDFLKERMDDYVAWIPAKDFPEYRKQAEKAASIDEIVERINADRTKKKDAQLNQLVNIIIKGLGIVGDESTEKKKVLKNVLSLDPLIQKALGR